MIACSKSTIPFFIGFEQAEYRGSLWNRMLVMCYDK